MASLTQNIEIYDYCKNCTDESVNLLWPFYRHEIYVRQKYVPANENILEYFVNKMLKIKNKDIEATATAMGLSQDLVEFIATRLKNKDDSLRNQHLESEESDNYEPLYFYQDAVECKGGIVHNFIKKTDVGRNKEVLSNHGKIISYAIDSERKEQLKAFIIHPYSEISAQDDTNEIKYKIRNCAKFIYDKNSDLRKQDPKYQNLLFRIKNGDFQLVKSCKLVYVRLNSTYNENNFEVTVNDFFESGVIYKLGTLIKRVLNDDPDVKKKVSELFIQDVKSLFQNYEMTPVDNTAPIVKDSKRSMLINLKNRPLWFNNLLCAKAKIESMNFKISDASSNEKYLNDITSYVNYLYSVLENGLYSLYMNFHEPDFLTNYDLMDIESKARLLVKKFNIREEFHCLFRSNPFFIKNLAKQHDLKTLLFLCLIQADIAEFHPFRDIIDDSNLSMFKNLNNLRNSLDHGLNEVLVNEDECKNYLEKVSNIMFTLFREMKSEFQKCNINIVSQSSDSLSPRKISYSELLKQLNRVFLTNLDSKFLEILLTIQTMYRNNDKSNYILFVYKIMEDLFLSYVDANTSTKVTIEEIDRFKSKDFPFPIPANIASANTKGIYNALNRQGFSLQADFWALLYVLDNNRCSQEFKSDMLSSFLELCDMYKINFFDFIEDVIEKRGHSINVESLKNLKIYDFHKKFLFIFKYFVENLL